MTKSFGRIITNLRKKKGLSQKEAASQLGISQSLLSHYEKGIRECGLEFLAKTADFYEVSTDYLLGRTSVINASDGLALIINEENSDAKISKTNTYCMLNRKLINNSASVTYSILSDINNKKLQKCISDYLSVAQYNMFRKIYTIADNNPYEMFRLENTVYEAYCDAALKVNEARIKEISSKISGPELSPDILAQEFSESFPSLNELIKNAEKAINQSLKV